MIRDSAWNLRAGVSVMNRKRHDRPSVFLSHMALNWLWLESLLEDSFKLTHSLSLLPKENWTVDSSEKECLFCLALICIPDLVVFLYMSRSCNNLYNYCVTRVQFLQVWKGESIHYTAVFNFLIFKFIYFFLPRNVLPKSIFMLFIKNEI